MLRIKKFLKVMGKNKFSSIVAKRMTQLGQPLHTSFFGYIDGNGCPYGVGYFLEEKMFVFISTYKVRNGPRKIAKELTEKEMEIVPKILLVGLVEAASTQKAQSLTYWYLDK
jgi:CxxC motif-containing protein